MGAFVIYNDMKKYKGKRKYSGGGTLPTIDPLSYGISTAGQIAGNAISSTSGSSVGGNVAGGALSGAASGFALGTVVPGIGNVVGAVAGGIAGAAGGLFKGLGAKSAEEKAEEAKRIQQKNAHGQARLASMSGNEQLPTMYQTGGVLRPQLTPSNNMSGMRFNSAEEAVKHFASISPGTAPIQMYPTAADTVPVPLRTFNEHGTVELPKVQTTNEIMKEKAVKNMEQYIGNKKVYQDGGQLDPIKNMHGVSDIKAGGTHEQNPMGGVPIDANNNFVEQGEFKYGKYIFSNKF